SELDVAARARNLRGAFAVAEGTALPAHVGLVDDVMTTGATLYAAARAARLTGVARWQARVCARVPRGRRVRRAAPRRTPAAGGGSHIERPGPTKTQPSPQAGRGPYRAPRPHEDPALPHMRGGDHIERRPHEDPTHPRRRRGGHVERLGPTKSQPSPQAGEGANGGKCQRRTSARRLALLPPPLAGEGFDNV